MDDEPFAEFSTVLFKKDQTTTVVPTNSLRTDGKGKTSAKWKNKWMEVRVVDQSGEQYGRRITLFHLNRPYIKNNSILVKQHCDKKFLIWWFPVQSDEI